MVAPEPVQHFTFAPSPELEIGSASKGKEKAPGTEVSVDPAAPITPVHRWKTPAFSYDFLTSPPQFKDSGKSDQAAKGTPKLMKSYYPEKHKIIQALSSLC